MIFMELSNSKSKYCIGYYQKQTCTLAHLILLTREAYRKNQREENEQEMREREREQPLLAFHTFPVTKMMHKAKLYLGNTSPTGDRNDGQSL